MYILFVITVSLLGIYHKVIFTLVQRCMKKLRGVWMEEKKEFWGGKRKRTIVPLKFIFSLEKKTKNLIFSFTTFYVKKKKKLSYYLWIIQDLQVFIPNGFSGLYFSSVVNNADSRLLYCSAFV